ncbi:MAG: PilZ domain-containing protein [Bacillota bacterium]|nr:PilZ domain-containing protein [Bacillota bacterium]
MIVSLALPRLYERVQLRFPSGAVHGCRVIRYDGELVLRPEVKLCAEPGQEVVLRRLLDGQAYLFSGRVVSVSPLRVTCSVPVVTRLLRRQVVASVVYSIPGGVPRKTRLVDVSVGGLCFHAWPPAPPVGEELEVEFELFPYGEVSARAVVRQVYGWTLFWPEVGVELLGLDASAVRVLDRCVTLGDGSRLRSA